MFSWVKNREAEAADTATGEAGITFEEFVMAYTSLFADTDSSIVEKNERIRKSCTP